MTACRWKMQQSGSKASNSESMTPALPARKTELCPQSGSVLVCELRWVDEAAPPLSWLLFNARPHHTFIIPHRLHLHESRSPRQEDLRQVIHRVEDRRSANSQPWCFTCEWLFKGIKEIIGNNSVLSCCAGSFCHWLLFQRIRGRLCKLQFIHLEEIPKAVLFY